MTATSEMMSVRSTNVVDLSSDSRRICCHCLYQMFFPRDFVIGVKGAPTDLTSSLNNASATHHIVRAPQRCRHHHLALCFLSNQQHCDASKLHKLCNAAKNCYQLHFRFSQINNTASKSFSTHQYAQHAALLFSLEPHRRHPRVFIGRRRFQGTQLTSLTVSCHPDHSLTLPSPAAARNSRFTRSFSARSRKSTANSSTASSTVINHRLAQALLTSPFQEAGASEVNLPDDDPKVLEALIHFLYHFNLDTTARPSTCGVSAFLVQVYAIADKYDVAPLRTLVVNRLNKACDPTQDVDDFIAALRVTDACTAGATIWDVLLPKAKTNISLLLESKAFRELVMEIPTLTLSLLGFLDEAKWAQVLEGQVVVEKKRSRAEKKSAVATITKSSWTEGVW